jgi:hypothetical protein
VERLEGEIRRELSGLGPQGAMPELLAVWPEAVGSMIAANAWPARIARDGTLHVNAASAAWAFELTQLAPTIAERLRETLGESAPKALRFAVGHVPEPGGSDPAARRSEIPRPTAEALQTAAELAAGIENPELRERVERAAALGLAKRTSDHPF